MDSLHSLSTQGFVHLPNAFPAALLDELEKELAPIQSEASAAAPRWYGVRYEGQSFPNRLNNLLRYIPHAIGSLLNAPIVRQLAEDACGNPWLSVLESIILKHPNVPYAVPLHRDMVHGTPFRLLTVGIYLDDTIEGGEIFFVPGSHLDREAAGERPTQTIRAQRGDIVIHDVQTLHGTTQNSGPHPIRTIYFELRPAAYFATHGLWSPDELSQRLQLMERIQVGVFDELEPLLHGRFLLEGAVY